MNRIKVLHLTSTPSGIGGVERLLLDMAPHYDRERFEIAHCNLFDRTGGGGPFPAGLRATGLAYYGIDAGGWAQAPRAVAQLAAMLRRERFDIVHLHMLHATLTGGLVRALGSGPRFVATKHYTRGLVRQPLLRWIDRRVTARLDRVVAISRWVAEDLRAGGVSDKAIRLVYNGLDLSAFEPAGPKCPTNRGTNQPGPWIGTVGNLHPRKGHADLMHAFALVRRRFPTARLMILGEGSERRRLEGLAADLGLTGGVLLPGRVDDVPAQLSAMDLVVHPARHEPFGLAVIEAMAAGKALVATSADAIPEIVVDGETGLLVPPGNPENLADGMCALLADPGRREALGAAARKRAAMFDIRATVAGYQALYEELASEDLTPIATQ